MSVAEQKQNLSPTLLQQAHRLASRMIVPYSEEYAVAHREFAERMWSKARRVDPRYLKWKYRSQSADLIPNLLLAVVRGSVVGQAALMPASIVTASDTLRGHWLVDLMVDPAHRGAGIGPVLLAAAVGRSDVILAPNPSADARLLLDRVGFRRMQGPRIMLLPLEPEHAIGWHVRNPLLRAALSSCARPLVRWKARDLLSATKRSEPCGPWPIAAGAIASREAQTKLPHMIHDESFLAWRCEGVTGYSEPLTASQRDGEAYAISGAGLPYYYVFDWWAGNRADAQRVLAPVCRAALQSGAKTIRLLANDEREQILLQSLGFISMRTPYFIHCSPCAALEGETRFHFTSYDCDGNL